MMTDENSEKMSQRILEIDNRIKQLQKRMEGAGNLQEKLLNLKTAYEEIEAREAPDIQWAYDKLVAQNIDNALKGIGSTALKDMTTEQLEELYKAFKMLRASISNANRSFTQGRNANINDLIRSTIGEIKFAGGRKEVSPGALETARQAMWDNLKPIYAMEKIGSDTFTNVFWKLIEGEGVYANDVSDAAVFAEQIQKKYGYDKWDFKKPYHFASAGGTKFTLSLEQIMSLYAYSKRSQADEHLQKGGFVFDKNIEAIPVDKEGKELGKLHPKRLAYKAFKYEINVANAHQLSLDVQAEILNVLEDMPQVKQFVDEMQAYLSDVMGAKGNEVSMALYDVKLFNEKNYFPLKSAKQYLFEQNEVAGEVRIKNSGFTNNIKPGANNPVILSNFMDVWANHIHDMSMYHSFVLPMEDFNRIFNGKAQIAEGVDPVSVKAVLENAYTSASTKYLKQLITDLNGGARSDPREAPGRKMLARFKKAKVMASASVVIQQPSSIIRAMGMVDLKYFVNRNYSIKKHKELWEELKQYAPVSVIKEMGRFDMDTSKGTADYIKNDKKWLDVVDDAVSWAPAKADEWAWLQLWEAVKRETAHTHPDLPTKSEKFMTAAGKRFTEIVVKTQVYDSTLSRSANMRSKSLYMNIATAFLAEPTTAINMVEQAIRDWNRGNKKAAVRNISAVVSSVVVNSLLVSLIYASRDDDEDETFLEKYFSTAVVEIFDGINPLTYVPFVKDVWSLLQGYSVERTDMVLYANALTAVDSLIRAIDKDTEDMSADERKKNNKAIAEASAKLATETCNLFGVPAGNVFREIAGAMSAYSTIKEDVSSRGLINGKVFLDILHDEITDATPVANQLVDRTMEDRLFDAIIDGDEAYLKRIEAAYQKDTEDATRKAITSARKKALKENDPRITKMADAYWQNDYETLMDLYEEIAAEGHFTDEEIQGAYASRREERKDKFGIEDKPESNTAKNEPKSIFNAESYYRDAVSGDQEGAAFVKEDMLQYVDEKEFNSNFRDVVKKHYDDGDVSADDAEDLLVEYGGHTDEEASQRVRYWDFKTEHPDTDISIQAINKYYDGLYDDDGKQLHKGAGSFGISMDVYIDYYQAISGLNKEETCSVIDDLPLTKKQKDALYYLQGWPKSNISKTPWH
jgi:hypothetical protein